VLIQKAWRGGGNADAAKALLGALYRRLERFGL
jgi:hypothetical protein